MKVPRLQGGPKNNCRPTPVEALRILFCGLGLYLTGSDRIYDLGHRFYLKLGRGGLSNGGIGLAIKTMINATKDKPSLSPAEFMGFFHVKEPDTSRQAENPTLVRMAPAATSSALPIFDSSEVAPISFADVSIQGMRYADILPENAGNLTFSKCLTKNGIVGIVTSVSGKSIPSSTKTDGKVYLWVRYHDKRNDIEVEAETVFRETIAHQAKETKQVKELGPEAALKSALHIAKPLTQLAQDHKHQDVLSSNAVHAIGASLGTHVPGHEYAHTFDSAIATDLLAHPSDENAAIQQHVTDWLEQAKSSIAANGKLTHAFQSKMPKSSARLHTIISRALLGADSSRYFTIAQDIIDLMRCHLTWETVQRQQFKPDRKAGTSPAFKPADFPNTFAGLCLFQRPVIRLSLLDVTCTASQKAAWDQIHETIHTYCVPDCTKCQTADVYKWFQELILLYHSENQVLITCGVSPGDRISMSNLQDKLGHLATLRTGLDSAEHTRDRLMDLLSSHDFLSVLSPTKSGAPNAKAKLSPDYNHPSKKPKNGLIPVKVQKMDFSD
jgi:hypothetical protein